MSGAADPLAGREIILEWHEYGDVARVNAVDAETGLEASAAGPRTASRAGLEQLALKKLAKRLLGDAPPPDGPVKGAPGRGKLV